MDAIIKVLNTLFRGSAAPSGVITNIFIVVISILLAVILAFVFRDFISSLANDVELASAVSGENQPLTASLANQKAVQLAEVGDYRSAICYMYLSALLLLDERGILHYNRSLTNREYLRLVRDQPDLENNLRVVVDAFDRVWYGKQSIDQDDYIRYVAHVSALEAIKK